MCIYLNVAKDFSDALGGRYCKDGAFSGEEFYENYLLPRFEKALEKNTALVVNLDNVWGVSYLLYLRILWKTIYAVWQREGTFQLKIYIVRRTSACQRDSVSYRRRFFTSTESNVRKNIPIDNSVPLCKDTPNSGKSYQCS